MADPADGSMTIRRTAGVDPAVRRSAGSGHVRPAVRAPARGRWESGLSSGWSSRRSQVPSGCLRATCTRTPVPSRATVAVSAMSPLTSVGSGDSGSKRGALARTFSHSARIASRPVVWEPGGYAITASVSYSEAIPAASPALACSTKSRVRSSG